MRKSDKKTEKAIIEALTEVCDYAQRAYPGFQWLTHYVDYDDFPGSLLIVCVFDSRDHVAAADIEGLRTLVKDKLAGIGITIRHARRQIRFDSEEACDAEQGGNWRKRLH